MYNPRSGKVTAELVKGIWLTVATRMVLSGYQVCVRALQLQDKSNDVQDGEVEWQISLRLQRDR